jgi:hypothetical protein
MEDTHIEVGDLVYAGETDIEGVVTIVWDNAVRLKVTKGLSTITDYYLSDLTILKKGYLNYLLTTEEATDEKS